jgi:Cu/Zn superoxide dismutase
VGGVYGDEDERVGAPIALLVLLANGSSSAAAPPEVGGGGTEEAGEAGTDAVARLMDKNGNRMGVVHFVREGGQVEVKARVRNVEPAAEFHGFHLHATGECDPNAVDPATGAVVPFFSAGGHLNPAGAVHGEHAGDFPVLVVQSDGRAEARFDTDRFRLGQLFDDGSAVIVHAGRDNYANIPATTPTVAERYHSHSEGVFGPD